MEIVDIVNLVVVLFLFLSMVRGSKRGIVGSILSFVGKWISLYVSYEFSKVLGPNCPLFPKSLLSDMSELVIGHVYPMLNEALWFVVIYGVCYLIIKFVRHLFILVRQIPGLNIISKVGGGIFGLLEGLLILWVIMLGIKLNIVPEWTSIADASLLGLIYNLSIIG